MSNAPSPFGSLEETLSGPGTATARASAPVVSLELEESVPTAINPNEINREATRWILFVGDVITPRQKRERPDLRLGGEYYGQQYRTLVRSKYLLRRAQLTPLEIGYDYTGDEVIGSNPNNLVVANVIESTNAQDEVSPRTGSKRLHAVACYPGDEIKTILIGDYNQDAAKGVLEAASLRDVDYEQVRDAGIQKYIFPEWDEILAGVKSLPTQLSQLVAHLESRRAGLRDEDVKAVIDTYLESAVQYREWGVRYLKYSAMLVRQPANQGFVHVYSDLAEMLFEQLEVQREDLLRDASGGGDLVAAVAALKNSGGGTDPVLINKLLEAFTANQELIQKFMTGGIPTVPGMRPVDVAPVETVGTAPQPEAPTTPATGQSQVEPDTGTVQLDPRLCSVITSSGRQCQKLARENGRCELPAHQPKTEE